MGVVYTWNMPVYSIRCDPPSHHDLPPEALSAPMSPRWTGCPGLQSFTSQWSMSSLGKDHASHLIARSVQQSSWHTVRQGAWGIGMTVRMDDAGLCWVGPRCRAELRDPGEHWGWG